MKRNILFILFFTFLIFSSSYLKAQTAINNSEINNQRIEVTPFFETKNLNNIPEQKAVVNFQKSNKNLDSLLPLNVNMKFSSTTESDTKKDYSLQRSQRINSTINEESFKTSINEEPFFPDFKVEATQEQTYDNGFVLQEKKSKELEKIIKVSADNLQSTEINTAKLNQVTISPSKRKYFEVVVLQLEKEIQFNSNNTSIEMQAKKKELEDLKKLLAQ